jgi:predicted HTH domain antitoxin
MKSMILTLPEETDEQQVKMAVAALLFDKGILSSGQAAEYAGITKRNFLETVGDYGVSIFGETPIDLSRPFSE